MTAAITPATSTATGYQPTPLVVPNTSAGALSSLATSLASQSAIVASLGGGSGVSVYTPSGLYNSLQQAGAESTAASNPASGSGATTATDGSGTSTTGGTGTSTTGGTGATTAGGTSGSTTATAPTPQQLADSAIIASLGGSPSTSGIYDGTGTLQSSVDTSSNWSTILKTNPELAGTVISSSFEQGIVATLNVTA